MRGPTAAEAVCSALQREGVDVLFGHPGGAILPFYDALYRAEAPRHVLTRHEQGAAHAADGYARATGEVGVCVATSGPGATNLVTGLATAMMDSVPVVALTGQVPTGVMGEDAFQETDILGITMSCTKHGFLVEDPAEAPRILHEAFRLARSGRPGPVVVDLPKDVQQAACPGEAVAGAGAGSRSPSLNGRRAGRAAGDRSTGTGEPRLRSMDSGGRAAPPPPDPGALRRAVRLVDGADRPLIMAGRGVVLSRTEESLRDLARKADLPVVTTLLGLDAFPASHRLCVGMPGMHGTVRANQAIQAADVILGLGLRFDDRVTGDPERFAPRAEIVHVDVDPRTPGRTIAPALTVVADLADVLPVLADRVAAARRDAWWRELRSWPRDPAAGDPPADPAQAGRITGRAAARVLAARVAEDGATVVTDVGQHQMWLAQELRDAAPGSHLTSGGLGTMGYALPAAVGAAVARPDRNTWALVGDGGFQMTVQELATVVQEGLPVKIAVFNNRFLGLVRQWQEMFYDRRYAATELSGPDLCRLAEAYGLPARSVSEAGALADAVAWAAAEPGPALLDLHMVAEENVFPMVATGSSLDEMELRAGAEVAGEAPA